jgi:hypothetical protein
MTVFVIAANTKIAPPTMSRGGTNVPRTRNKVPSIRGARERMPSMLLGRRSFFQPESSVGNGATAEDVGVTSSSSSL